MNRSIDASECERQLREARALQSQSVLRETPLAKWWHRRRNELRRNVVCGIAVRNENLAGYCGRSALSGRLYCPHCEDIGGCL